MHGGNYFCQIGETSEKDRNASVSLLDFSQDMYFLKNDFQLLHYFRFSRNAVVCSRDGVLTLLFRVANLRPSHLIEAHVRALVISRKITDEGEVIPFHQTELKVSIWH